MVRLVDPSPGAADNHAREEVYRKLRIDDPAAYEAVCGTLGPKTEKLFRFRIEHGPNYRPQSDFDDRGRAALLEVVYQEVLDKADRAQWGLAVLNENPYLEIEVRSSRTNGELFPGLYEPAARMGQRPAATDGTLLCEVERLVRAGDFKRLTRRLALESASRLGCRPSRRLYRLAACWVDVVVAIVSEGVRFDRGVEDFDESGT
jgi:hypothetical protein